MKLKDMLVKSSAFYSKIESAQVKMEMYQACKYIQKLSSASGIDCTAWEIDEVFKRSDGLIYSDKTKINEIFFQWKDHKPKYEGLTTSQVKAIDAMEVKGKANKAKQLLSSYNEFINSSNYYAKESNNAAQNAARVWIEYLMYAGEKHNAHVEVEALLKDGFFKLASVSSKANVIIFETVSDVVLSYYNKVHMAKYAVNMGKYCVSYFLRDGVVKVAWADGVPAYHDWLSSDANRYCHPHVSQDGYVCFGEEKYNYADSVAKGKIHHVMTLVQHVLSNYHDGAPYVRLEAYKEAIEAYEKDQANKEEEQKQQPLAKIASEELERMLNE